MFPSESLMIPSKSLMFPTRSLSDFLGNQKSKSISGIYIDVDTTYFVLIIKQIRSIFQYGAIRKSNVMWSNFENANVSLRSGIFCQSGQKRR